MAQGNDFTKNYNAGLIAEGSPVDAQGNPTVNNPSGQAQAPTLSTGGNQTNFAYGRGGATPTAPAIPAAPAGGFTPTGSGANVPQGGAPTGGAVPGLNPTESGQYTNAENTLGTPNTVANELSNEQQLLNGRRAMASDEISKIMAGENAQVTAAQKNAEYGAAASGMLGTPGAGEAIREQVQPAVDQAQGDLAKILLGIDQQAESDANLITQQNQAQATGDITTLNNIATARTAAQTNAQGLFTAASKTPGVDFNSFINSPYGQQLLQSTGYDPTSAALVWNSNQNVADQIQWTMTSTTDANGNPVWAGVNPKTGQLETQTFQGGPPAGSSQVNIGGLPYYQQNNADGTPNTKGILMPAPLLPAEKNAQTQEYQVYVTSQTNAGQPVLSFFDWQVATKTASTQFTQTGNLPTSTNPQPNNSSSSTSSSSPAPGAFSAVQSDPTSSASVNNLIGLENPTVNGSNVVNGSKFVSYPDIPTSITQGTQTVASRLSALTSANPNATIMDLANSWKGSGNNDASAWANAVAQNMGVPVTTKLSALDPSSTFYAIANHESSFTPTIANGATPQQVQQYLTSGPSVAGETSGALYNAAVYGLLGIAPPSGGGFGLAPVKKAVANKQAEIQSAFGISDAQVAAAQSEYSALSANQSKLLNTAAYNQVYTGTATDNLNLALKASDKTTRTPSPVVNKLFQNYFENGAWSNAGLSQFETYIYTAAREYAKVTGGGATSAAGLTDSAQAEADKLLNAAQSPAQFSAVVSAMQQDMANVNTNFNSQLSSFAPNVANLLGPLTQSGGGGTGSTSAPASSGGGSYQDYLKAING